MTLLLRRVLYFAGGAHVIVTLVPASLPSCLLSSLRALPSAENELLLCDFGLADKLPVGGEMSYPCGTLVGDGREKQRGR